MVAEMIHLEKISWRLWRAGETVMPSFTLSPGLRSFCGCWFVAVRKGTHFRRFAVCFQGNW